MDQERQSSCYTTQMLEEVPLGIAQLDADDFHILTANRAFRETAGPFTRVGESADGGDPLNLAPAATFPFSPELLRSVAQTGQAYQGQAFPALHPERGTTYWNGSITPVGETPGELDRLLVTLSDVTAQTIALLQAQNAVRESLRPDDETRRLAAVEAIARRVSRELVSEDIARVASETLVEILDPSCVYLHLAQPVAQELRLVHIYINQHDPAATGLQQISGELSHVAYDSSHWIARARHQREPILLRDLREIPRAVGERSAQILSGGYIYIPLWFKDHLEGTLVVLFRETLGLDSLLVRILRDCCTCISAALAHSRLLTEVERERERLRAVLDHSPEGIFLVEAHDMRISYANEAAAHIINIPKEYLIGTDLARTYAAQQRHFSLTNEGRELSNESIPLLRALKDGATTVGEEMQFTRPDGKIITLLVAAGPIWSEADVISGAVTIFQDITVRKSIEQQKNEFLSIASHELRTPTTAIQGFAEILQMFAQQPKPDNPQIQQILVSILEQSTRLTRLINEMLDISYIEQHQLAMHIAPHNLAITLKRARENMAVIDRQHPLTIAIEGLTPDEELYAEIDEERILQVLSNFISNAMKYSPPGSEIELGLRYNPQQSERARLWVRDSGIGIPAGDLPHIFERFHRAENFDRSISGLGIGLYLAHEIITRHAGLIWAESQEGVGSTFFVELPLHQSVSSLPTT